MTTVHEIVLCSIVLVAMVHLSGGHNYGEGYPCTNRFDCRPDNMRCVWRPENCDCKVCQCKNKYSWDGNKCKKHREVGSRCEPEDHICPRGAECIPDGNRFSCQCTNGGLHSENDESCGLHHGDRCTADSDCLRTEEEEANPEAARSMSCLDTTSSHRECQCSPGFEFREYDHARDRCAPMDNQIPCVKNSNCPPTMMCGAGSRCTCRSSSPNEDVLALTAWDDTRQECVPTAVVSVGLAQGSQCTINEDDPERTDRCEFGLACIPCMKPFTPTVGYCDTDRNKGTKVSVSGHVMSAAVLVLSFLVTWC